MSKQELKDYYRWFMDALPKGINELAEAVRQTPGFETWQPDCTPASLDTLGEWFAVQVEKREQTEEEIQKIKARLTFPMEIPREELTDRTFSLAVDIGMYFSQVLLKNHPSLRWNQPFGGKLHIDYGQPVLAGFGAMAFNPVHMMTVLAHGLADKKRTGEGLREIYDIWSKKVQPTS
jgi:hypothetical protein